MNFENLNVYDLFMFKEKDPNELLQYRKETLKEILSSSI